MWFHCSHERDSFRKAVCVDDLEEFDFRLCELCHQDHAADDSTITLYLQSGSGDLPSRDCHASVLLFFLLLDPQLNKLEYLGSASADENDRLFSFCIIHVRELCERMADRDCSFFVMDSETAPREILPFNPTVAEVNPRLSRTSIWQMDMSSLD